MTIEEQKEKDYMEAQKDVLKAAESVRKLSPEQREKLAKDVFGIELVQKLSVVLREIQK